MNLKEEFQKVNAKIFSKNSTKEEIKNQTKAKDIEPKSNQNLIKIELTINKSSSILINHF